MGRFSVRILPALLVVISSAARAADLQPHTAVAFDRYVQAIETQMPRRSSFLWVDRGDGVARQQAHDALARGEVRIASIGRGETGIDRDIPGGLIHHWIGTVFIPGATIDTTLALLQDYDRHASIYTPA